MASDAFDLVVIGAGAAGSAVATAAAGRGFSVALVEEWKVGGTCLNIGCDPTKALVRCAEVAHLARTASRFGIEVPEVRTDWPAIRAYVNGVIDRIRGGDGDQELRDQGITLVKEHGRFVDGTTIVAGDHQIAGKRILVATGARPTTPPIDGLDAVGYITSQDVVHLDDLPASIAIIGSGPIGVEFAQIFVRLGVEVTLVGTRSHILPREEPELRDALLRVLQRDGVHWVPEVRIERAERRGSWKVVRGERDGAAVEIEAHEILVATGRAPNVEHLGLEAAGIRSNDRGIVVDTRLRTSNPVVYAVGDVTGIYMFTHVADYQARVAEYNLFDDGEPIKADYRVVPWVTYTNPELARVGLTEEEARAGGFDVVAGTMPFADLPRAITMDEPTGMVKLVVDRRERTILGGHILGSRAGELIGEVATVMERRIPVDGIIETIHPYPTMSEGIFWTAYEIVNDLLDAPAGTPRR
ncbi:MAG TPA: NAD(P)/FAD-dependent oxidoreductase [Thermomicrobiales bacterium]|nr:NAD(P)/FAD-dependent oxidoreductase [Thermomicrobiales bacterium]